MATRQRSGRYPCGVCRRNCVSDCLMCGHCKTWFHSTCEGVDQNGLKNWADVDGDYVCRSCRTVDGTEFDYLLGVHRLEHVSNCLHYLIISSAAMLVATTCAELDSFPHVVPYGNEIKTSCIVYPWHGYTHLDLFVLFTSQQRRFNPYTADDNWQTTIVENIYEYYIKTGLENFVHFSTKNV